MLKKLFVFLFLLDVIIIGQTTGSVDITPSSHLCCTPKNRQRNRII
jgi:hypothetical protein